MSTFTKPEWNSAHVKFECVQNGFGQWWPKMRTRSNILTDNWYEVIIRDRDPFKTLKGAIKFTEATIKRIQDRENKKQAAAQGGKYL